MVDDLFGRLFVNETVVFFVTVSLLLVVAEVGFRFGMRLYISKDLARKEQIGGVQAAVLGMLGLLLGFTFAMAVNRFDTRRALVLKEANSIGTTFLRAGFLPTTHQEPIKNLLRRYVAIRLRYQPLADEPETLVEGVRSSTQVQSELWRHARGAAVEAPNAITASFVESLNEMIDTDAERQASMRSRIPGGVWMLLLIVAVVGCMISGYGSGSVGARSALNGVLLPMLVAAVICLIFDLSHPRQGLIGVSQQPLIDLQATIGLEPAANDRQSSGE